jgi:quercetin dioxygenase-like cupin family protein
MARALDPINVAPKHCKVEFENDQVRVLRWVVGPHEKVPMHEHPSYVTIFLTDDYSLYTLPDEKAVEVRVEAGHVSWSPGTKHAAENLSDKLEELIQVELKSQARSV